MNVPTLIAGVIVILLIGSIILFQVRNRKKGKCACSCGCDCGGCGMSCSCHPQK